MLPGRHFFWSHSKAWPGPFCPLHSNLILRQHKDVVVAGWYDGSSTSISAKSSPLGPGFNEDWLDGVKQQQSASELGKDAPNWFRPQATSPGDPLPQIIESFAYFFITRLWGKDFKGKDLEFFKKIFFVLNQSLRHTSLFSSGSAPGSRKLPKSQKLKVHSHF